MTETTKKPAERVLAAIVGETWAITESGYEKLIEIASRENVITPEVLAKIHDRREAVAAKKAARMDGTDGVVKRGDVAIIDVIGPIMPYADLFTAISGATSIEALATDFQMALDDATVRAIVLNFDSPGGLIAGVNEFANMIANRANRKPVAAYVGIRAASAAYWIAAACDEIVIEPTADAGSIGLRLTAKIGSGDSGAVEVVSSRAPKKALSPDTEAGRAAMQHAANVIETVFVDNVAKWRALTPEQVTAAEGGLLIGQEAVDGRLADRLGSLESLLAELSRPRVAAAHINQTNRRIAMTTKNSPAPEAVSADAENPEIVALKAQIDELTKLAKASEDRASAAEIARLTTEANAQVDAWERDGRISGNGTAKVRELYVAAATGKPVTTAQIADMMAALPKVDGSRIAKETRPAGDGSPTREDFLAADSGDKSARDRIDAHVKQLVAKDATKKYTAHLKAVRTAAFALAN